MAIIVVQDIRESRDLVQAQMIEATSRVGQLLTEVHELKMKMEHEYISNEQLSSLQTVWESTVDVLSTRIESLESKRRK